MDKHHNMMEGTKHVIVEIIAFHHIVYFGHYKMESHQMVENHLIGLYRGDPFQLY